MPVCGGPVSTGRIQGVSAPESVASDPGGGDQEPSRLVVLLQTSPRSAVAVVERLGAGGVEAVIPDQPNAIAFLMSFGTYRVRVAVAAEDEEEARAILARWEPEARANVAALSREIRRQFLLALVPGLALVLALALTGRARSPLTWLGGFLLWVGAMIAISLRSRFRS